LKVQLIGPAGNYATVQLGGDPVGPEPGGHSPNRIERSPQAADQHGTGPTAGWSRADQVQVRRGGTRCGTARGRTQLDRSRANRVRVGAEPTNAADQHGTGPTRARPEPGRPSPRADRARLRRSGPPSAADQHGTRPTPGWSRADRSSSSSSSSSDGSSGKQQQLAGAEWSIAPHAASPDGAGSTLRPDPARADRSESDGAEHAADMHGAGPTTLGRTRANRLGV